MVHIEKVFKKSKTTHQQFGIISIIMNEFTIQFQNKMNGALRLKNK